MALLKELSTEYENIAADKLATLLSCAYALISPEAMSIGLPDFPIDNIDRAAKLLNTFPYLSVADVLNRLYPCDYSLNKDGINSVQGILQTFKVGPKYGELKKVDIEPLPNTSLAKFSSLNNQISQQIPTGSFLVNNDVNTFISNTYHDNFLTSLVESHVAGDICIIGPRGCGKSLAASRLANSLGYSVEPIVMYQDMTSRDLIQQRTTQENGDTVWKNSPLVNAALEGKLAILDGLHRVHPSTISILHRLVLDRELQMYDGRRLIKHDRYDDFQKLYGAEMLEKSGILRIHPSFRILALAEPNMPHTVPWLNPEMLTLFLFHEMRPMSIDEETHIISSMFGKIPRSVQKVLEFSHILRKSTDANLQTLASSLSTRQLIRIAKRSVNYEEEDPYDIIQRACLSKFLPQLARNTLDTILLREGIVKKDERNDTGKISVKNGVVTIGSTETQMFRTDASSKVPDILFYDVPQHIGVLEKMLQDFLLGEHLLLIGNQGVGKNKLADKLLQLLNRPREYIQLHRDTTVQSLTLQPTVKSGIVTYEDSPLVIAVKNGYILVVDEADKAPTNVTCILKTLVESGEMILSDGRRIVPLNDSRSGLDPNVIPIHPEFRMIVLANRPGFPFLGNDFFGALGDLFSCHAVDNPSRISEIQLLQNYGPNVPLDIINKLVSAFGRLRTLSDEGLVAYPYSTRELVNIVKHLQAYPDDSVSDAVGNVFDFDRYSKDARDTLLEVLGEYKIPISMTAEERKSQQKRIQMTIERDSGKDMSGPKFGKVDEKNEPHVGGNTWAGGTGGRDTAGLGGKGGPFRLDAGHDVHQISDEEKAAVPEHIRKAAREMGLKAFKEKLKEIEMSEYDHQLYEQYSVPVAKQVQALRVILNSLQAKSKERHWHRHQTTGELDDTKLIEGVTGEKNIYRRRADKAPEVGSPQMKPKRLKLVVDVSGSMYRFNGYDGRLDRELEAVVLVMEAFHGFESRFQYDIIGHSGEAPCIPFVDKSNPPTDNKHRLGVLRTMHAHAQFCMSGDYTLDATEDAVKSLAKEDCDEAIVIVLSDANLSRYAIPAKELSASLTCDPRVEAYTIFIGSLGNQAEKLCSALPAGKGYVCFDLKNLPHIMQTIFTSSMLKTS